MYSGGITIMKEFTGYKKGINLGGWLSQPACGNFTKEHLDNFVTESDIAYISSLGLDHVRLPIDYEVIQKDDGSLIESGFSRIEKCIQWCVKHGLRIVLDLHKACGYVFDDESNSDLFHDQKLQTIFIELWKEMTRRFGKYSDIAAFELLNEITDKNTAEAWNAIAAETIAAIRAINTDIRIIIGGYENSSIEGLSALEKPADENIVFTFHCYNPLIFTHQSAYWVKNMPADFKLKYPAAPSEYRDISHKYFGDIYDRELNYNNEVFDQGYFEELFSPAVKISEKYNVPLYCGEYGVIDLADTESAVKWFCDIQNALKKFGIAHAAWTYKNKDFGLTDEHYSDIFQEIINNS